MTSRTASETRSGPPGSSSGAGASSSQTGAKFRHGLLQLMIHTIDPLHDGKFCLYIKQISIWMIKKFIRSFVGRFCSSKYKKKYSHERQSPSSSFYFWVVMNWINICSMFFSCLMNCSFVRLLLSFLHFWTKKNTYTNTSIIFIKNFNEFFFD